MWLGCANPATVGGNEGSGGSKVTPAAGAGGAGGGQGDGGSGGTQTSTGVTIKLDGSMGGSGGAPEDTTPPPPTDDANCGNATSSTVRQPADVLLVLDRSSSMNFGTDTDNNCSPTATNCTPRWPALTTAVNTTLDKAPDINWGLKLFTSPRGSTCTVNAGVEVPVAATSVADVKSLIGSTTPSNYTPTAQAVEAATAYLKTLTDTNDKFILLATDGEPNCAPGKSTNTTNVDGTVAAIEAAAAAGFPVYVIGIGPSVGNLDNFAAAGGTGNYYPATSPEALTDAFASISKLVATCTFTSTTPPPDPENIAVYLNKQLVQKDDANGWSLGGDGKTVTLNGTSCETATSDDGTTVQILFGCPGGPPPPQFIP